jgi:PKD repeat protein
MDSLIYVAEIPDVGFSLKPEECLPQGSHQLFYVGSGNQQDTYQWDLSSLGTDEVVQNPGNTQGPLIFDLKNSVQAKIGLQVLSRYGCKSKPGEITIKRSPLFSFSVANEKGCVPLEIAFEALPGDNIDRLNYSWNFGDRTTGTGIKAYHTYIRPDLGCEIGLTALSSLTGCSSTINKPGLVSAYPMPIASFYTNYKASADGSADIEFINNSVGAVSYLWDFGDRTTSEEINPSHIYSKFSHNNVLLKAYNDYSCSDTVSHEILVGFDRIYPPNAFSPYAPNGVDREFRLTAEGVKSEGYHFTIISRWNDLVFETKNEIRGWQGRLKNGNMAPAGNYVWVLDFFDSFGRPHHQTGTVTLIY